MPSSLFKSLVCWAGPSRDWSSSAPLISMLQGPHALSTFDQLFMPRHLVLCHYSFVFLTVFVKNLLEIPTSSISQKTFFTSLKILSKLQCSKLPLGILSYIANQRILKARSHFGTKTIIIDRILSPQTSLYIAFPFFFFVTWRAYPKIQDPWGCMSMPRWNQGLSNHSSREQNRKCVTATEFNFEDMYQKTSFQRPHLARLVALC